LWLLRQQRVDEARTVMAALLAWQQPVDDQVHARTHGAFASAIERRDGRWQRGTRFYAGDNLVVLAAILALHEQVGGDPLLERARRVGQWLSAIMCRGERFGAWSEPHGAPMQLVTASGDFVNRITTGVPMLWLSALHRLGDALSERRYCRQADRAYAFLRAGQASNGAFMDHYEPGFPAEPYDPARWRPHAPGQLIGDNLLRAALGACRFGDRAAAGRLADWLQVEDGAVCAYVDADTGGSGFEPGARDYYDVTSSGLYRALCLWLGRAEQAAAASAFLERTQLASGGWYWGLMRDGLGPLEPQLSPMPGLWATADLSRPFA
jgi:hypothetical protein